MQISTVAIIGGLGKTGGRVADCLEPLPAEMTAFGLPRETTDLPHELFTQVLDGRNSHVADGVRQILGRQPKDFSVYARETAATGIWSIQS